jgi:hypothetical protein
MAKSGNYLLAQQMREEAWARKEIARSHTVRVITLLAEENPPACLSLIRVVATRGSYSLKERQRLLCSAAHKLAVEANGQAEGCSGINRYSPVAHPKKQMYNNRTVIC